MGGGVRPKFAFLQQPNLRSVYSSRCLFLSVLLLLSLGVFFFLAGPPLSHVYDLKVAQNHPSYEEVCAAARRSLPDKIPKIMHTMWKTAELEEPWASFQQNCGQMNPDYEIKFWTDASIDAFLQEHYPWFYSTYLSYPHRIQRPDAARYFILYHYGGVYKDVDIDCRKPFDDVIKGTGRGKDVILARTDPTGFTNNLMIAKARHPFTELLTKSLLHSNQRYLTPHWTIMRSAGPCFLHKVVERYPCSDHLGFLSVKEHAEVVLHQMASTWHEWDGGLMQWVNFLQKWFITLGLLFLVVLVILPIVAWRKLAHQTSTKFARLSDDENCPQTSSL